jgi:hypothetical protein
MILPFLRWVQNLEPFSELRGSAYVYPVVLALHLCAIALFAGMILLTDLRLLGWALRRYPVASVVNRLRVPKRIGFLFAATFGLLLFCSKAEEYYYNPFFRTKVLLFVLVAVHALLFRRSVYTRPGELDLLPRVPNRARLAASLSLLIWIGILVAGRGIGYVPGRLGIHYSSKGFGFLVCKACNMKSISGPPGTYGRRA